MNFLRSLIQRSHFSSKNDSSNYKKKVSNIPEDCNSHLDSCVESRENDLDHYDSEGKNGCLMPDAEFPLNSAEKQLDPNGPHHVTHASDDEYESADELVSRAIHPDTGDSSLVLNGSGYCGSSSEQLSQLDCGQVKAQEVALKSTTGGSPVSVGEETPVSISEETPVSVGEETPVSVGEDSPVSVGEDPPVSVSEDPPVAVSEDPPVAVSEDSPVAVSEDPPVSVSENPPVSVGEEHPISDGERPSNIPDEYTCDREESLKYSESSVFNGILIDSHYSNSSGISLENTVSEKGIKNCVDVVEVHDTTRVDHVEGDVNITSEIAREITETDSNFEELNKQKVSELPPDKLDESVASESQDLEEVPIKTGSCLACGDSEAIPIPPSGGYNLEFLDDPNFNPFESKLAIRSSPPRNNAELPPLKPFKKTSYSNSKKSSVKEGPKGFPSCGERPKQNECEVSGVPLSTEEEVFEEAECNTSVRPDPEGKSSLSDTASDLDQTKNCDVNETTTTKGRAKHSTYSRVNKISFKPKSPSNPSVGAVPDSLIECTDSFLPLPSCDRSISDACIDSSPKSFEVDIVSGLSGQTTVLDTSLNTFSTTDDTVNDVQSVNLPVLRNSLGHTPLRHSEKSSSILSEGSPYANSFACESVENKIDTVKDRSLTGIEDCQPTHEQSHKDSSYRASSLSSEGQIDNIDFDQLLGNEAARLAEELLNTSIDTLSPSDVDNATKQIFPPGPDDQGKMTENPFQSKPRVSRSPNRAERRREAQRSLRREEDCMSERDMYSTDDSGINLTTNSEQLPHVNQSEAGPDIATGLTPNDFKYFSSASELQQQLSELVPYGSRPKLGVGEVKSPDRDQRGDSCSKEEERENRVEGNPSPPHEERSAPEGTSSPTPRATESTELKHEKRPEPPEGFLSPAQVEELLKQQELQFEEKLKRATASANESKKAHRDSMKDDQKELVQLRKALEEVAQSKEALLKMVGQYKGMLASLVSEKEKEKQGGEERMKQLETERDQAIEDLANVETAFSDVHRKYERTKQVVDTLHRNEETLRKAVADYEAKLQKHEQKFLEFQKHAEEKMQQASKEYESLRRSNETELTKMAALLKKAEMKILSLQDALERKGRENQELTQLCDDLIGKMGSSK